MTRENPLPLLFAFLMIVIVSNVSSAQTHSDSSAELSTTEEVSKQLDRIERKVRFGPHYKNKNAAGRLLTLNRAVPNLPATYAPLRVYGPSYKNRRIQVLPRSTEPARATKAKLTGPRYKNRGAKSGGI